MTLDTSTLRRVRRLRSCAYPMGLSTAVEIARAEMAEPAHPFLSSLRWDDSASGEVDGFTVRVEIRDDYDSRLGEDDVTGTFSDEHTDGAIPNDVNARDWHDNGVGLLWYIPSEYDRTYLFEELRRAGMSRGVAADTYRAVLEERARDDRSRSYYLVHVVVSYDGEELADDWLGGVDIVDDRSYLLDCAAEMIGETIERAREELPKRAEILAQRAAALRQMGGDR